MDTMNLDPRETVGISNATAKGSFCIACLRSAKRAGGYLCGLPVQRREVNDTLRCAICGWRLAGPLDAERRE